MNKQPIETGYTTAWLSKSALEHNVEQLRRHLNRNTKICGVVKADCYGHGWDTCLKTIAQNVDFLGVATLEEASSVAAKSYGPNILAFSVPAAASHSLLKDVISLDVVLTITSMADMETVSSVAATINQVARVHVKVDTGMARSGVWHSCATSLIQKVRSQPNIELEGLYTHFSSADERDKTPTRQQFDQFMNIVSAAGGADELLLHACNSSATLDLPEYQLGMVRPGIAIYGIQPSLETERTLDLKPILKLTGRLVAIKEVPAGTRIGYGRTYECQRAARIGLVQVGYADGYRRVFSNNADMRLNGTTIPVRGNVSMDQTVVDISNVANATIGDEVEIFSPQSSAPNSVSTLATRSGLIPYEILCGLGDRVDRILIK